MRIFSLTVLSVLGIFIVYIIYTISIQVSNLEYSQSRVLSKKSTLTKLNIYKFDYDLSLMKSYDNKLFFVSWTEGQYNKLFYTELESISEVETIDLEIDKNKIVIGEFFIKDSIIEIFNKFNSSLIKFNKNGKKISEFIFPFFVNRIAKVDQYNYIISGWEDNNENYPIYFKTYNSKENLIDSINFEDNSLNKYSYMSGLILDGMYFNNQKYVVNLPYSINKSFVFNKYLKYEKPLDLIYKDIDFKFRNTTNGDIYASPHNVDPNISGYLNSSNIFYLLSQDEYKNYFVDLYNIEQNKYLNSFVFKGNDEPRYLFVSENKFYILFQKDLIVYKID